MQVAVVIPFYNRAIVTRAVDSVLQQSLPARQVIAVDDGSDDAEAVRARFAAYPQVELIQQTHQGVSAARNRGILAAKCEWIAFLDSDDVWLPDKLQKQAAMIRARDALACHTDEIWIRNGRRVNPKRRHAKPDGEIFAACLPLCCVSPSAVVLHASIFARAGLFDESLPACEDYDLWLRVFHRYPIALVAEGLTLKYGGHADQLSRKHWGMDRFRIIALQKLLRASTLSQTQRAQAQAMLRQKCAIMQNGALRRGDAARAKEYAAIARAA